MSQRTRQQTIPERRQWRLTSPKATELAPPLERAEQAVVMDWCTRNAKHWPELRFVFASPNGAYMHKATAALMVRQGLKAGLPDIMAPFGRDGFLGLAVEMKRKPNKPTDLQLAWLDGLTSFGWKALACYSATEAINVLEAYVSAPKTMIVPMYAQEIPF